MPKVMVKSRPTAVGCYIFAGGFTVGVSRHFTVQAHLEDGPFGVATVKTNFPNLPVHTDPDSWPVDDLRPDLVYCNPPCAPWSTAGIVAGQTTEQQQDWKAHPMTKCVGRAYDLLPSMGPLVWTFESVRQAHSRGCSMLDDMAGVAMDMGYSVTDLFTEAKDFGVPQRRKRYFFLAHMVEIDWQPPRVPFKCVYDMLAETDWQDDMTQKMPDNVAAIAPFVPQGKNCRAVWDKASKEGSPFQSSRPAFLYDRMRGDTESYTILGSCNKLHPDEDRFISVNETRSLCGFPHDYKLVGKIGDRYAQLGKGVCPPVADWLASQLAKAIVANKLVTVPVRREVIVSSDSITSRKV